jgi:hypothetical protein
MEIARSAHNLGRTALAVWYISRLYKPDHADPFWLPVMPVVLLSLLPSLVLPDAPGVFIPLSHAAVSSVFNLTVGLLIALVLRRVVRKK